MRDIVLLYDRNVTESFLYDGLKKRFENVTLINNPKNDSSLMSWFKGSYKAVRKASKGGKYMTTIVCWFDFQAVLCYWISVFCFKPVKLVAINILLKNKNTLKNKIVTFMYRKAMSNIWVEGTVTAEEMEDWLYEKLGPDCVFSTLHDVYSYKDIECEFQDCGPTVFTGGINGRDWKTAFSVARKMPEVNFYLVCPGSIYKKYKKSDMPSNITFLCDISPQDFIDIQKKCSITYLPLDTNSPAGLIVMYQAAALEKFVITTDTMVTRDYISDDRGCRVKMYDVDDAVEKIHYYLENVNERKDKSRNLKTFLQKECEEEWFIDRIASIC